MLPEVPALPDPDPDPTPVVVVAPAPVLPPAWPAASPLRANRPRAATDDPEHPSGQRGEVKSAKWVKPAEVTALHLALLSRDLIP